MSNGFKTYREYTATEYNSINQSQMLKCLSMKLKSPQRRNYEWKVGEVNTLCSDEVWTPSGSCRGGGLYFCNHLNSLVAHRSHTICIVSIPDDARVWVEKSKAKTDKLFLKKVYSNIEFVKAHLDGSLQVELDKPLIGTRHLYKFLNDDEIKEILLLLCKQSLATFERNKTKKLLDCTLDSYREVLKKLEFGKLLFSQETESLSTLSGKGALTLLLFARIALFSIDILDNQQDRILQELDSTSSDDALFILKMRTFQRLDNDAIVDKLLGIISQDDDKLWECAHSTRHRRIRNYFLNKYFGVGVGLYHLNLDTAIDLLMKKINVTNIDLARKVVTFTFGFVKMRDSSCVGDIVEKLAGFGFSKKEVVSFVEKNPLLSSRLQAKIFRAINLEYY